MKTKTPKLDPTRAAALIPGQVKLQKDCRGRPIKVGDRVDDTTFYIGGIVVAVFGEQCIFLTDYDGDYGIGRFATQQCAELRLLPPVTDLKSFIKETLAFRATIDKAGGPVPKDSDRREMLASQCTRIEPELCKDENGRLIEISDIVLDETNDIGGVVVGLAGKCVMFKMADGNFDAAPAPQCISTSGKEDRDAKV